MIGRSFKNSTVLHVDVFGIAGCPNVVPTVQRIRQAAADLQIAVDVCPITLSEEDDPAMFQFLGSPTILIAGLDIEPAARGRSDYAFGCRMYDGSGQPSMPMIRAALQESLNARAGPI